jgi:hypothetical protein
MKPQRGFHGGPPNGGALRENESGNGSGNGREMGFWESFRSFSRIATGMVLGTSLVLILVIVSFMAGFEMALNMKSVVEDVMFEKALSEPEIKNGEEKNLDKEMEFDEGIERILNKARVYKI